LGRFVDDWIKEQIDFISAIGRFGGFREVYMGEFREKWKSIFPDQF
jgi:hypothetical protein